MADERGGRYFREARFFFAGDKVAAQSHILEARSLMGYMRDQRALGGPAVQTQVAILQDGTQIKAVMMNGQYQAQIFSPRVAGEKKVEYVRSFWFSGIARPSAPLSFTNAPASLLPAPPIDGLPTGLSTTVLDGLPVTFRASAAIDFLSYAQDGGLTSSTATTTRCIRGANNGISAVLMYNTFLFYKGVMVRLVGAMDTNLIGLTIAGGHVVLSSILPYPHYDFFCIPLAALDKLIDAKPQLDDLTTPFLGHDPVNGSRRTQLNGLVAEFDILPYLAYTTDTEEALTKSAPFHAVAVPNYPDRFIVAADLVNPNEWSDGIPTYRVMAGGGLEEVSRATEITVDGCYIPVLADADGALVHAASAYSYVGPGATGTSFVYTFDNTRTILTTYTGEKTYTETTVDTGAVAYQGDPPITTRHYEASQVLEHPLVYDPTNALEIYATSTLGKDARRDAENPETFIVTATGLVPHLHLLNVTLTVVFHGISTEIPVFSTPGEVPYIYDQIRDPGVVYFPPGIVLENAPIRRLPAWQTVTGMTPGSYCSYNVIGDTLVLSVIVPYSYFGPLYADPLTPSVYPDTGSFICAKSFVVERNASGTVGGVTVSDIADQLGVSSILAPAVAFRKVIFA